ncbi:hypothetical protein [Streptomyces canarius]
MAVVVAAAIGSTLLYAGVGALVGDTAARHVGLPGLLFSAALYDLLLAPFIVPGVMWLARRRQKAARSPRPGPRPRPGTSPRAGSPPARVCASAASAAVWAP